MSAPQRWLARSKTIIKTAEIPQIIQFLTIVLSSFLLFLSRSKRLAIKSPLIIHLSLWTCKRVFYVVVFINCLV